MLDSMAAVVHLSADRHGGAPVAPGLHLDMSHRAIGISVEDLLLGSLKFKQ